MAPRISPRFCSAPWCVEPARGPGVPAALSSSIFDRFHRADDEGDGMGLGLWIAKSIVERHSGRIAVVPAAGGGARFTLTLPIAEGA